MAERSVFLIHVKEVLELMLFKKRAVIYDNIPHPQLYD